MSSLYASLEDVQKRIALAAARSGRNCKDIQLVAVTKTVPVERILEGIAAGINVIGENRVQEAAAKYSLIGDRVCWHLIGHLQKNKVKKAVGIFALIHSVDSLDLAQEISCQAVKAGKCIKILLQVNVSGEASKFGLPPSQVYQAAEQTSKLPQIKLCGLMTIPPLVSNPEDSRPYFRSLARLRDELSRQGIEGLKYLSMGMSQDFEVAIEEGANLVRVGSAIFGKREVYA